MNPYIKYIIEEKDLLSDFFRNRMLLEEDLKKLRNLCGVYILNQDYISKLEVSAAEWNFKNEK